MIVRTCMLSPMPAPSTTMSTAITQYAVWASSRDSRYSPTAITSDPATGKTLYRPVRPTMVPAAIEVPSRPMTNGKVCSPELVAETPFTYCRYVGRKVIAPSIAKPTMKASTTQTLNTDERNKRNGSTGSTARLSTRTNTDSDTTEPTNRPMIITDVQAYCVPPHERARVSPAAPSDTNTIPR